MITSLLKKIKFLILGICILFSPQICGVNVIFDLGGVLIETNTLAAFNQLGIFNTLHYIFSLNNPLQLKNRLFELLNNIETNYENVHNAQDGQDNKLPNIFCEWLAGESTIAEIKEKIASYTKKNPEFFNNSAEKDLLTLAINNTFSPESLTKIRKIIKPGLKFVKECKKQGHTLFILSNWDKESFPYTCEKFSDLFELFDADKIIISGDINLIKPDPTIYEYLLKSQNLDPKDCIFFDDQEINVEAANQLGIHGVICKKSTYKKMIKELNSFVEKTKLSDDKKNS